MDLFFAFYGRLLGLCSLGMWQIWDFFLCVYVLVMYRLGFFFGKYTWS